MKKKIIGIFVCTLLIATAALPVSGDINFERANMISNQNDTYYSSKVFLIGLIKDWQLGSMMVSFTAIHVFGILLDNCNGTKIPRATLYKNSQIDFPLRLYEARCFFGFISFCGVFHYPKVTASPASIPIVIPAELELTVTTRQGIGLANVWVSIEIPGLTGEMNTTTDANGTAKFSFTPPSTGDIIIKIENNTIPIIVKITA